MTKRPLIGLGAGGHGRVLAEVLRECGEWDLIGFLDVDPALFHTQAAGFSVLGGDEQLPSLLAQGVQHAFLGIGSVNGTQARRAIFERTKALGFFFINVLHPQSIISPSAEIGEGSVVLAGAVVNTGARVGANVIVNTAAVVEHDCEVSSHVHIATGARLAGGVRVEEGAFIGVGATIKQGIRIGARAVVGAGGVVIRDVLPGTTVVGVPARVRP